jgi:hypothetical protein
MKARNNYTPEFKAKVVLEILSEVETVNQSQPSMRLAQWFSPAGRKSSWNELLRYLKKVLLNPKKNSNKAKSILLNLSVKWASLPMR